MKRLPLVFSICIGITFVAILIGQHFAQAQRPDAPGGGSGRPTGGTFVLPLEAAWAQICFEFGVEDEKILKARTIFKKTWDERKELIKKAEESTGDREAMQAVRTEAEKLRSDVTTKLKDVLSPEQMEKFAEWEKKAQEQSRRPPEPPFREQSPE